jgi:hypothetical protein
MCRHGWANWDGGLYLCRKRLVHFLDTEQMMTIDVPNIDKHNWAIGQWG